MKKIRKRREAKRGQDKIGAFDVETNGLDATKFLFGVCMWYENDKKIDKVFFDKVEMFNFMVSRKFRGYTWYAHNITYDLTSLLGNFLTNDKMTVTIAKGRFIQAKYKTESGHYICFRDTMNYVPTALENIGKDIGIYKLDGSELYSGNVEVSNVKEEHIRYCKRDCEIVLEFVKKLSSWVYDNFNVRLPSTTGSLSLRIFLTKFVNDDLLVSGYDSFFRNSYYGGRCEVIESRGESVFARCYDFNSLYPTVMRYGKYPDPSSLVYEAFPTIDLIHEFEGVSECTVYVPDMKIPPLPVKFDGKLIFPVGLIRGWWNHNELRLAVKYGVRIEKIHKTVYATRTVTPFIHFVDYFYKLRKVYKAEGHNSESLFCKLILNSLYGKFGQMNEKRTFGWVDEEKGEGWMFEPFGDSDFGVWKKVGEDGRAVKEDARHSVLCWASYITSWARIYLYRKMMEVIEKGGRVFYCDTDSVFTDIELETGNELGQVKLEYQGWFKAYAPKVYQVNLDDHHKIIKVKGVHKPNEIRSRYTEIRVIRPLEALRGNKEAGKPVERVKLLSLLDEKRDWSNGGKPLNYLDLLINKEMRNFKKKEVIKGQRYNLIEVGGQIRRIKTRVEVDQDLEYLYNIIREDIIMRLRGDVDESAR